MFERFFRGGVMSELLLDRAGRHRSPATMPGFHAGRPPGNKGVRYPADPPKVEEIVAVMRAAGDGPHGRRLRGLIVVLWRAGLRIQECALPGEADLDQRRGSLRSATARAAAAAKSAWTRGDGTNYSPGWTPVSSFRRAVVPASSTERHAGGTGPTPPRARTYAGPPPEPVCGGSFAPHQLRRVHAVEMADEGRPLVVIQRRLGHSNLGITSIELQGIDNAEIIDTVHARHAPMVR